MFLCRFRPCQVEGKQVSVEEITARCLQVSDSYRDIGLVNSFSLYRRVIDALEKNRSIEIRPLARLMGPVSEGRSILSLRHDMDADIVTGLRAARFLASRGIPGSFYILPTSHYYGEMVNKVFYRYSALADFVAGFVATGCEFGVHADPLHFYCKHGCDGINALKAELEWLRSRGASISGVVAHNSAVVYGAENFEVFRGMAAANRSELKYGGRTIQLQSVAMKQIGLDYEGNYPILPDKLDPLHIYEYVRLSKDDGVRKSAWLDLYFLNNPFFDRQYEVDIWLLGEDSWVIADRGVHKQLIWPVTTADMLTWLNELQQGVRVVMNIHPEYVSGKVE